MLVGIRLDAHAKELLDWAVVKVADSGDSVVAIHVCRNSGTVAWVLLCFLLSYLYTLNSSSFSTMFWIRKFLSRLLLS